ncbi:MAG: nitroreductase family protein [Lentisphaerae bacterium]|nr:nitroreductase family protein [Lentisphaerota bacterium]
MDALEAIAIRHSTRRFLDRPVPKAVLEQIVEAARHAATANNEQPWTFVVVTERARLAAIAAATDFGKCITGAAACVAVGCLGTTSHLEDGAAATQTVLIAATALGVQSCWVAGHGRPYEADIARLLGLPSRYRLVSLVALGYEAEPGRPPRKRDLASLIHWEVFDSQPARDSA